MFSRDSENVLSEAEIPFTKAVFGGPVHIETLKGMKELKLEPGTKDGTKKVLKGAGM